jgi:hypothetical protein
MADHPHPAGIRLKIRVRLPRYPSPVPGATRRTTGPRAPLPDRFQQRDLQEGSIFGNVRQVPPPESMMMSLQRQVQVQAIIIHN